VKEIPLITGAEDFAYYGEKIPSFFFMVGVTPKGTIPQVRFLAIGNLRTRLPVAA
jgi:metal-dependent amidase/aminoacylase/carboxypeptidase family protein